MSFYICQYTEVELNDYMDTEDTPSNSRMRPVSYREKILYVEEEKVEVMREILVVLKEISNKLWLFPSGIQRRWGEDNPGF